MYTLIVVSSLWIDLPNCANLLSLNIYECFQHAMTLSEVRLEYTVTTLTSNIFTSQNNIHCVSLVATQPQ